MASESVLQDGNCIAALVWLAGKLYCNMEVQLAEIVLQ